MARGMVRRVVVWTFSGAVLGAMAGAVVFAVMGQVAPRYSAEVLYEVLPSPDAQSLSAAIGPGGREEIERYMETMCSVVASDRVLERAVKVPEVAATSWAQPYTVNGKYVPEMALPAMRSAVHASIVPSTNLIRLRVTTSDPTDAGVLARTIDDAFRRDTLESSTREARDIIDDIERRIREGRQDIAAIDIRIDNISKSNGLTMHGLEQTTPFLERELVLEQLVDTRVKLARLPEPQEGAAPDPERLALVGVERSLSDRLEVLNEQLTKAVMALTEVKNLREERDRRMQMVRDFDDVVTKLRFKIERGNRVRVLSPPTIPDERASASPWPFVGIGALALGALGLLIGLVRTDAAPLADSQAHAP